MIKWTFTVKVTETKEWINVSGGVNSFQFQPFYSSSPFSLTHVWQGFPWYTYGLVQTVWGFGEKAVRWPLNMWIILLIHVRVPLIWTHVACFESCSVLYTAACYALTVRNESENSCSDWCFRPDFQWLNNYLLPTYSNVATWHCGRVTLLHIEVCFRNRYLQNVRQILIALEHRK